MPKRFNSCLILAVMLAVALFEASSFAVPSASDGETALNSSIQEHSHGRIVLRNFKKTDALEREFTGVQVYELEFDAEIEFTESCKWFTGPHDMKLSFRTEKVQKNNSGSMMSFLDDSMDPGRLVQRGDRFVLSGRVSFVKKESGWKVDKIVLEKAKSGSLPRTLNSSSLSPRSAGQDTIVVSISGGQVGWLDETRRDYLPVTFELKRGEQKPVEFHRVDKPHLFRSINVMFSKEGAFYLDPGMHEIEIPDDGWHLGRVYYPKEVRNKVVGSGVKGIKIAIRFKSPGEPDLIAEPQDKVIARFGRSGRESSLPSGPNNDRKPPQASVGSSSTSIPEPNVKDSERDASRAAQYLVRAHYEIPQVVKVQNYRELHVTPKQGAYQVGFQVELHFLRDHGMAKKGEMVRLGRSFDIARSERGWVILHASQTLVLGASRQDLAEQVKEAASSDLPITRARVAEEPKPTKQPFQDEDSPKGQTRVSSETLSNTLTPKQEEAAQAARRDFEQHHGLESGFKIRNYDLKGVEQNGNLSKVAFEYEAEALNAIEAMFVKGDWFRMRGLYEMEFVGNEWKKRSESETFLSGSSERIEALFKKMESKRKEADDFNCLNHLKQIGLSIQTWQIEHEDALPFTISTNSGGTRELLSVSPRGVVLNPAIHLVGLSNELSTPSLLICPADKAKSKADDFEHLTDENVSYELRAGQGVVTGLAEPLVRCPIHGHSVHANGRVERDSASVLSPSADSRKDFNADPKQSPPSPSDETQDDAAQSATEAVRKFEEITAGISRQQKSQGREVFESDTAKWRIDSSMSEAKDALLKAVASQKWPRRSVDLEERISNEVMIIYLSHVSKDRLIVQFWQLPDKRLDVRAKLIYGIGNKSGLEGAQTVKTSIAEQFIEFRSNFSKEISPFTKQ